ncbi:unnamed protein product, partial [Penicillium salamii]
IPVTRVECEASNLVCSSSPLPMRSQAICPFIITTVGWTRNEWNVHIISALLSVDTMHQPCADVSTDTKSKA